MVIVSQRLLHHISSLFSIPNENGNAWYYGTPQRWEALKLYPLPPLLFILPSPNIPRNNHVCFLGTARTRTRHVTAVTPAGGVKNPTHTNTSCSGCHCSAPRNPLQIVVRSSTLWPPTILHKLRTRPKNAASEYRLCTAACLLLHEYARGPAFVAPTQQFHKA